MPITRISTEIYVPTLTWWAQQRICPLWRCFLLLEALKTKSLYALSLSRNFEQYKNTNRLLLDRGRILQLDAQYNMNLSTGNRANFVTATSHIRAHCSSIWMDWFLSPIERKPSHSIFYLLASSVQIPVFSHCVLVIMQNYGRISWEPSFSYKMKQVPRRYRASDTEYEQDAYRIVSSDPYRQEECHMNCVHLVRWASA